jgi:hypothetical protein
MPTEEEMADAQRRIAQMKQMKAQQGGFFGHQLSH